ncbi:hypothetical protein CANARDRAFT_193653 [[Candida] arabinofermentans NRRL YB-2248]|uniref:non-specific serine/threonine protein kinase n=1 Tax=[Candida] arabinofermentans NRRL YB-2248 TaxID=983967 RepID=A0A1E4T7X9_9ASCO|nr:hypothetical protein CANARDRAFT_193653 [[Candida] arabinofermentans NRRL YB-2248]
MRTYSVDQFQMYEELGRGAFGVVYRAKDKVAGIDVAIKQVDLESSDEIKEIQQEIKILSTCNTDHVTKYYGCFLKGSKLWIIMEYLGGGSCSDLLTAGPFSEEVIGLIMFQLLQALVYLHENGKIHRDFKAANVLISNTGVVKIGDFGVATQLSNNMSKRNTFVGTPYWMPPEIIKHKEYHYTADIWSLGITAIEMAYGKPPLSEFHPFDVLFKIADEPSPTLGSSFSTEFNNFVDQCLQKDPSRRPTAKILLNHSFIKKGSKTSSKQIINLIDKKVRWEIETGNNTKIYYTPTHHSEETIRQIVVPSSPTKPDGNSLQTLGVNGETHDAEWRLRRDFNRILNQSFNTVAEKYNLSTSQYDSLVKFQTTLMDSVLLSSDQQYKDIFNKFIKLILKKVMKSDKPLLKERLLPRLYLNMESELAEDDIEELLFSRWAEGMLSGWGDLDNST